MATRKKILADLWTGITNLADVIVVVVVIVDVVVIVVVAVDFRGLSLTTTSTA